MARTFYITFIYADMLTCEDQDCSVVARDADGNTALHLACRRDDTPTDIIIALFELGVDPLAVNEAKQTAFELAVNSSHLTSAPLIVSYLPADKINHSLPSGASLFQVAQVRHLSDLVCHCHRLMHVLVRIICLQQAGDKATIAALIARGVDIGTNATNMTRQAHDQKDDVILAALVGVIKQSVLDMLDIEYKRMVEAGLPKAAAACLKRKHTDLSAVVDEQQQTFVHKCAAEGGTYQLCVELLLLGVPINAVDKSGNTPLHTAAKSGNLDVAKALCEHGADVMARNKNNRTPKMVVRATTHGHAQFTTTCSASHRS